MLIALATAIALAHLSGACGASGPATPDFNQTACLPAFENDALCLRGGSWTTTPQGGQRSADLTAPFTSNPDSRKTPQAASPAQAFVRWRRLPGIGASRDDGHMRPLRASR